MKLDSKAGFTQEVDEALTHMKIMLADSPRSLASHIHWHLGFYQGVCICKGWDSDIEFLMKWEKLEPR